MAEPSSEAPRNKRQHARGKSVDVGALSLNMNEDGEFQPMSDGRRAQQPGRAKSMDLRGAELEEIRDMASLMEDGSAKASYKNALREKAMRKGRIFQPLAPPGPDGSTRPTEGGPLVTVDPAEAAFNDTTMGMEKKREQLEVDIYGLEQDIRVMTRALEQKAKALKDANAILAARERERDWETPGDVRPRAQRFPSDQSSTGSPSLTSVSPPLPAISLSPVLSGISESALNLSSPSVMSASSPSSSASYQSALPSPIVSSSAPRHSLSSSGLRLAPSSTPPLQPGNPSVMFVVPSIPFPSSRATASPRSATPPSPRRSPFRHLNKER